MASIESLGEADDEQYSMDYCHCKHSSAAISSTANDMTCVTSSISSYTSPLSACSSALTAIAASEKAIASNSSSTSSYSSCLSSLAESPEVKEDISPFQRVIEEIVDTERTYVNDLQDIVQVSLF